MLRKKYAQNTEARKTVNWDLVIKIWFPARSGNCTEGSLGHVGVS